LGKAYTYLSMWLLLLPVVSGSTFLTIGDWGGAALQETTKPYHQNVLDVAKAMDAVAKAHGAKLVVNTGDNFYWCGLGNSTDFQIKVDWLDPFQSYPSLQVPWFSILGNHEYGYNITAQIDLGKVYKNWVLDARYYTRRVGLDSSKYVTFIFLDTSACVSAYRTTDPSKWDPCSTEYPTCSLSGGHDEFEGPCRFHENIMASDCGSQFTWFQKQLNSVPKTDWLIVVGHHAADEMDVYDFVGAMQKRGFDLYLNGHEHMLTHYMVDDAGAYVTSGAGSLVMSKDQMHGRVFDKVNNKNLEEMANLPYGLGHTYKPVFTAVKTGFTVHTFSPDFKTLTTDFLDTAGGTLHSFSIQKQG